MHFHRVRWLIVSIEKQPVQAYASLGLDKAKLIALMRKMLQIRTFEEKVEELFLVKGALIGPSHLYLGQEAVAAGILSALQAEDQLVTTYRCHGHGLAKGVPSRHLMAELYGKSTGTCKGLGGSMHASIYTSVGSAYATAIVGSGIPIAAGMALGFQYQKQHRVVVTFFGDGAVNTGAFHEGVNLAGAWKLPVIFVCENNFYAMSTRMDRTVAAGSIAERGQAYGIATMVVDGNDVVACYKAGTEAAELCRKVEGPVFMEVRTYKMKGHGVYDKGEYRPSQEVHEWVSRDPVASFRRDLIEAEMISEGDFDGFVREARAEVEEAVRFAEESPILPFEELPKLVYV
jgi:TPP-dependent pyruvate/acetoin dehydrogenase alpha subunit